MTPPPFWNFSKNSSVLEMSSFPYGLFTYYVMMSAGRGGQPKADPLFLADVIYYRYVICKQPLALAVR